jgi:hypothetical protein
VGKKYRNRRSRTALAAISIQLNAAAVLFNDAAADPQSQPGTTLFFGSHERIEQPCLELLRNTDAIINNANYDAVLAGLLRRLRVGHRVRPNTLRHN